MARFKRYRRRYTKRNSYRVIRANTSAVTSNAQAVAYTFTATEACVVKGIKLDTGVNVNPAVTVNCLLPWVLVRVPEGYDAAAINFPATDNDLYNPTGEVLASGVLTDSAVEDHKYNGVGRKMKPGDRLALIYYNPTPGNLIVSFEISFSVLT
jgi:hypothetical protein